MTRGLPMIPKRIPVLKSLHWLAKGLFKQSGYRWEVRRSGELRLGLWRKEIRKRMASEKKTTPKRFVVVPGFGDTPLSWLPVISILRPVLKRAGYDEIVLVDFPGFNGFLAGEKSFHSMDLLIGAVADAFDSLEPDTILGHSLGGWLASRYAAECGRSARPKVQKRHGYRGPKNLILVCPGGMHSNEEMRQQFEELFRRMVRGEGINAIRKHLFAKEPFWFKWLESEFARFANDEGICQFTESVRDDHLVQSFVSDIKAKTWFVWGEVDTLCPTECVDDWMKGLCATEAPARAVLIRGVGHSPQVEAPAVTAAVLGQIIHDKLPHEKGARWWKVIDACEAVA